MTAAFAALPAILQLIQIGVPAVENLIAWVSALRTAATQSGEWTTAMETAFLTALLAYEAAPEWQPDPVKN